MSINSAACQKCGIAVIVSAPDIPPRLCSVCSQIPKKDAEIAALRAEVQMLTRDRDLAREAREENVKSLRAEIADRQAAESLSRELARFAARVADAPDSPTAWATIREQARAALSPEAKRLAEEKP